jgi:hypothetical protein
LTFNLFKKLGDFMKLVLVAFVTLTAAFAQANTNQVVLLCKQSAKSSCSQRVLAAFNKLGCQPVAQSVHCEDAATSPNLDPSEAKNVRGKDFCVIQSKCEEPSYSGLGGVSCDGSTKVNLKDVDSGITLDTSVGLFRHFVTTLCK